MFKKLILSPYIILLTLTVILTVRVIDPVFVESIRLRYFDTLIASNTPTENNIYTVDVDEDTLANLGQWPLPRDDYARIIEDLYNRNAGLVVFNVLMPEADRNGKDKVLAATMQKYPVILPSVPSQHNKNIPRNTSVVVIGPEWTDRIVQYHGIISNVPVIENNAYGVGIVNTFPEVDGVNRRIPLVANVDGKLYPSLSIEVLRVLANEPSLQIKLNQNGVEKLRVPKFGPVTTDSLGRIWIDYNQKTKNVSLMNLPENFDGAIVIVGLTANGLSNPVPTSLGPVYPHHVQANVIGTMVNNVVIQRPDYADAVELIVILVLGILIILLSRWVYMVVPILLVLVSGHFIALYLFTTQLWLYDATAPILGSGLVYLHAYTNKFISEFLQKQEIKKQFSTYLSPALVEKLQKNPELLVLGGETRELSIMFTDVRGFTTISEHYGKDVQGLTKLMNRYMTAMTAKILENEGTLDKYIGDAQMAFWNAPLDDPRHAHKAVRTAISMMESLDAFNNEITKEGIPAFGMGLGINTAEVVVGNMGSSQRFDYTCLGDGVNLASRFEGQSKPYGVRIVLGEKTQELVRGEYFTLKLDTIAVKGKTEGATIFTVLETDSNSMVEYLLSRERHDMMLEYYCNQQWPDALKLISELIGEFDSHMDTYYIMMQERIKELEERNIPSDWDGIFRATSK